jgi:c-di-GMP-related signal transduction protein
MLILARISADSKAMDVFVARQPIFDRGRRVYGYELLFRASGGSNSYDGTEESSATIQVIANALFAIGLEDILRGKKGFVNFGRGLLIEGWRNMLPKENTVIELLESVPPDSEVLQACQKLRELGYMLALDDFVCHPSFEPLTKFADMIKVDIRATTKFEAERVVRTYQPRGIRILAEKVETYEEYEWAHQQGFDYFQGYFFARPELRRGRQISTSKIVCLRLLQEAAKRELDFDRLETLIGEDVSFSYKLLRYVNSVLFYRQRGIHSICHALVTLGEPEIRHWIALAALPRMAEDKPGELVRHSILRARFCEIVARLAEIRDAEDAFLIGLFSQLDALLDRPLELALAEVNLAGTITSALLGTAAAGDKLAAVYNLVRRYESGDFDTMERDARQLGIAGVQVSQAYFEASHWANQVLGIASDGAPTDKRAAS